MGVPFIPFLFPYSPYSPKDEMERDGFDAIKEEEVEVGRL